MGAPNWPGLYKWAARYSDGTDPSSFDRLSVEDKRWLSEAMEQGVVDNVARMKAIKGFLDSVDGSNDSIAAKAELLDELTEIVENIDFARDLHKIGGLQTLVQLLDSPHAALRWRAAEVVGMAVQSNEPVQQWFLEGNVMPPILHLLHDIDNTCRAKALLALSCLVRHSPPALAAFHAADGMSELSAVVQQNAPSPALGTSQDSASVQQLTSLTASYGSAAAAAPAAEQERDPRQLRKALQLLTYIAQEDPRQVSEVMKRRGLLPALRHCLGSGDQDVRQWALGLMAATSHSSSGMRQLHQEADLAQQLEGRLRQLSAMDVEDLSAVREELSLVEALVDAMNAADDANCRTPKSDAGSSGRVPELRLATT